MEQIYIIHDHPDIEDCTRLPVWEFNSLIDTITTQLLTFFEQVTYSDDPTYNHLLGFICETGEKKKSASYTGYYVAMNNYYAPEWLDYYRKGILEEKFKETLEVIHYQMKHSNPKLYSERH